MQTEPFLSFIMLKIWMGRGEKLIAHWQVEYVMQHNMLESAYLLTCMLVENVWCVPFLGNGILKSHYFASGVTLALKQVNLIYLCLIYSVLEDKLMTYWLLCILAEHINLS